MPLTDWLDAGYVMLTEKADGVAHELLDRLFMAGTVEDLDQAMAALTAEMEWRRSENDRVEAEQRRHSNGPRHVRIVDEQVLEDAWSEWTEEALRPDGSPGQEPTVS